MGVPFDGAVSCEKGSALAPEKIRSLARYLPILTEEGFEIDMLDPLYLRKPFFNI